MCVCISKWRRCMNSGHFCPPNTHPHPALQPPSPVVCSQGGTRPRPERHQHRRVRLPPPTPMGATLRFALHQQTDDAL